MRNKSIVTIDHTFILDRNRTSDLSCKVAGWLEVPNAQCENSRVKLLTPSLLAASGRRGGGVAAAAAGADEGGSLHWGRDASEHVATPPSPCPSPCLTSSAAGAFILSYRRWARLTKTEFLILKSYKSFSSFRCFRRSGKLKDKFLT